MAIYKRFFAVQLHISDISEEELKNVYKIMMKFKEIVICCKKPKCQINYHCYASCLAIFHFDNLKDLKRIQNHESSKSYQHGKVNSI